jgi:predicted small secreted protein
MNPIFLFRSTPCRMNGKARLAIPAWALCLILGAATLAQGFGQDVEHVGDKIEDAARR